MSATPRTVLVVDDEAPLRRVLERSLSRHGLRVIGAGSAETAYELLAAEQPDALLLDIHLPTMSGLALYLAIVHRWPARSEEHTSELQSQSNLVCRLLLEK